MNVRFIRGRVPGYLPLVLVILIFYLTVFIIIFPQVKQIMMAKDMAKLMELVDAQYSFLSSLDIETELTELDEEAAKEIAFRFLSEQRHGAKGEFYYWIMNLEGVVIMHPYTKHLVNVETGKLNDPQMEALFARMVALAKTEGRGYLEYRWQLPGSGGETHDKVSYIRLYEPWGWIIGTGLYTESTYKEISQLLGVVSLLSLAGFLSVVLIIAGVTVFYRRVNRKAVEMSMDLEKSENRYSELIDTMSEGFIIQNSEYVIEHANSRMCSLLGYTSEEVTGKRVTDFLTEDNREIFVRNMLRRKTARDDSYELVWTDRAGEPVYTLVSPRGLYDGNGRFAGSFAIITDIRRIKETEQALSDTIREKQSLIMEVHHRVKNSLQLIISLISIQKEHNGGGLSSESVKELEDRIQSVAFVYELLYEQDRVDVILVREYIKRLTGYLLNKHPDLSGRIKIDNNTGEVVLPIDKAVTCGLLLNELACRTVFMLGRTECLLTVGISLELRGREYHFEYKESASEAVCFDAGLNEEDNEVLVGDLIEILILQLGGMPDKSGVKTAERSCRFSFRV